VAIDWTGFDNEDITEAGFSKLMVAAGVVAYKHGVSDGGLTVSPGAGTREVSISAGEAFVAGVWFTSTATVVPAALAANAGSSARTDYVVLEVDWTANTCTLKVIQGASSTPPDLTQTAGTLWQMPLARVSVPAAHNTVFSASHITVCKPLPRDVQVVKTSTFTGQVIAVGGPPDTVATLNVTDPGWPYRLRVQAVQRFETDSGAIPGGQEGYGLLIARIDGTELGRDSTDLLTPNIGFRPARLDITSDARSGPAVVTLLIGEQGGVTADNHHTAAVNRFEVHVLPA
jgi:hypothetical protein